MSGHTGAFTMADEVSPPRPLTPATFHILVTLAQEPSHGYQIKRMVEDRTAGAVRLGAGTLYSGIRRMEKDGLIEETQPPAERQVEPGARWRFYAITERGTEALEREIERLEADLAAARAVTPRPA
jgi:DNA-binding PadR family transcriptional regulator